MPHQASRTIRVFVSSTFRDFREERDRLARFTFPAIRHVCEERAVVFTDVDLRWGITDEQAAEGHVLPICLAEIEASRPFFIGMLGERYGWVPDAIPEALLEREPWLAEHLTRSVTELEIMHGVLNDPEMAGRAVFYFRDPSYLDDMEPERRGDFEPEDVVAAERLAELKCRIADSAFPVRTYRTVEELDALVRADLEGAIDALFPADETPDALTAERLLHAAFASELVAGFVARPALGGALDTAAACDGSPLLVTGEPGYGKSATLADFADRYPQAHPDDLLVTHFCGASGGSADWAALCRRVAAELGAASGIEPKLPDDPDELRAAFKSHLYRVAAARPFVLVIDGVDQLVDDGSALDLGWLPPEMPAGARLLISAASGTRPAAEALRRGWGALEVGPLPENEREAVLASLLARRRKSLPEATLKRICAREAASNALFLSALVEELSVVGDHHRLEELLARYLAVEDPDDVFELVFARWEADYDVVPGLTRAALSALWAARKGLTETELTGILGDGEAPLPQAHLAPLLLAAGRQLVSRSGLLTFAHASTRCAVEDRYLGSEELKREAHVSLAGFFATQEPLSTRTLEELPWQLRACGEWDRLAEVLAAASVVEALLRLEPFEVRRYWASLIERDISPEDVYSGILGCPANSSELLTSLGILLLELCALCGAERAFQAVSERAQATGDLDAAQLSLGNRALIHKARGELDQALELLADQEGLCRELALGEGLLRSLGNQAAILIERGELDTAMGLLLEQERISRELNSTEGIQVSIGNQATIHMQRGQLDRAMTLLLEQEHVCRGSGDPTGLLRSLGNQALVREDLGEIDQAIDLLLQTERLCRELGDKSELRAPVRNRALLLWDRRELDLAIELLSEEVHICRELGDRPGLPEALVIQARVRADRDELDEATELLREAERICRDLGDSSGLSESLFEQATIQLRRGVLSQALNLLERDEGICNDSGDTNGRRRALEAQARIHEYIGRRAREAGDCAILGVSLGRQASIHLRLEEPDQAMRLLEEQELVYRGLGDSADLQRSLGRQALIYMDRNQLGLALPLLREQETLCRELGDQAGLSHSLANQGYVYMNRGQLKRAMEIHAEDSRICRELGDEAGLDFALNNLAVCLLEAGRPDEALPLVDEAIEIATRLESPALEGRQGLRTAILRAMEQSQTT